MLVNSSLSVICTGPVQFDRPWSYRWGSSWPRPHIAVVVRSNLWRMSEILPPISLFCSDTDCSYYCSVGGSSSCPVSLVLPLVPGLITSFWLVLSSEHLPLPLCPCSFLKMSNLQAAPYPSATYPWMPNKTYLLYSRCNGNSELPPKFLNKYILGTRAFFASRFLPQVTLKPTIQHGNWQCIGFSRFTDNWNRSWAFFVAVLSPLFLIVRQWQKKHADSVEKICLYA
jgi:hypothetical protein